MTNINFNLIPLYKVLDNGLCSCGNKYCKSPGKHPSMKGWRSDERKSINSNRHNIGIQTGSGLLVIDVDFRSGGAESMRSLMREIQDFPVTVKAKTGGGGYHLYYEVDEPFRCRNNWRPGIDIKCEGGYVVAPPSNHASGVYYEWDHECGPNDILIERLPEDLKNLLAKDLLREEQQKPAIGDNAKIGEDLVGDLKWLEAKAALDQMNADDYDIWIAVGQSLHSVSGRGLEPFELWDSWSKKSDKYDGSTARKWASFKAGNGRKLSTIFWMAGEMGIDIANLIPDEEGEDILDNVLDIKEVTKTIKEVNLLPPGVAGEAGAALEEAYHVIPSNIAIALASQFLPAALLQDKVKTPTYSNLGMYMLMIGASGTCKSVVKKLAQNIIKDAGATVFPKPASHTAFGKRLSKEPIGTILQEELVSWMSALANKPAKEELKAMILDYWQAGAIEAGQDAAMGEFAHGGYEDVKLSIIGGGVPTAWETLMENRNFFEAGFNTRLEAYNVGEVPSLIAQGNPYDSRIKPEIEDYIERLNNTRKYLQQFDENFVIKWGEGAKEIYVAYQNEYARTMNEAIRARDFQKQNQISLRSRLAEIAVRVASRVVMANFTAPDDFSQIKRAVLDKETMQWAVDYTEHRFSVYYDTIEEGQKGSEAKFMDAVLAYIEKSPSKTRYHVEITRNKTCIKHLPKATDRKEALSQLVECGKIEYVKMGKKAAYRLAKK